MRIGKDNNNNIIKLDTSTFNKHGIVAGSSGSGKTTTIKTLAEQLNKNNISTLLFDAKGDLKDLLQENKGTLYTFKGCYGINLNVSIEALGLNLLSNILELNNTQHGILATTFLIAKDLNIDLTTLQDLEELFIYITDNNEALSTRYGRISNVSIGTIRRKINAIKLEELEELYNYDNFNYKNIIDNKGINIIDSIELVKHPKLYASIVVMVLRQFYNNLEESEEEQPKTIIFIDEAHLLFKDTNKDMIKEIDQIVRLIRSKGIGLFFISQSIQDIPNDILNQLTTKVQHQLHLLTTQDYTKANAIAKTFNDTHNNKDIKKTVQQIKTLETGQALIQYEDNKILINNLIKIDYISKSTITLDRLNDLTPFTSTTSSDTSNEGINTLDRTIKRHTRLKNNSIILVILLIILMIILLKL